MGNVKMQKVDLCVIQDNELAQVFLKTEKKPAVATVVVIDQTVPPNSPEVSGLHKALREKAEKEGIELVLLQQDIAELDFDVPNLDCILCACDGFNYLTYDDELESVFEKAHELLKDDGIFIFDISSYYKLSTILGNNMYGENREDVAYMWQNYFDSEENVVEMELAFFIKEEDGRFTRFEEVHQQRAYTEKEVLKMLKKAGFTNVKTYGDFTFDAPIEDSERIFFVCKK